MASYALTDIIQQIRDTINEPTARIFTDTQLTYFIDMGASVCSAITLCSEVSEDESTVASQYVYSPSTELFFRIESVELADADDPTVNRGLQRVNLETYGHLCAITDGSPQYYFVHGAADKLKVYVAPAPSSTIATNDGIIRINGYERVTQFGGAASETLPDSLQFVPYYYGMSCVYARLGKHRLGALNIQKFIDECNNWRIEVHGDIGRVTSNDLITIPDQTVSVD